MFFGKLSIQNEYIYNIIIIYYKIKIIVIIIAEVSIMAKNIIKIHKKGEDGYKVISVRIKEGILQKIDKLSDESNRSRNELINIILENSVDDVEIN